MRLEGRVILVTGSTTGVGEGIARRCHAEGATVVIHGRREEQAQRLVEELGDRASFCLGDLSEAGVAAALVAHTVERWGRIDGLVNNAASSQRTRLEDSDRDTFFWLMALNVRAPLETVQAALPHFRTQGRGQVVNIGSMNAYKGHARLLDYSVTKGALMTLTRNLAAGQAQSGLRVNQLNIGWTLTENEKALIVADGMPEGYWENPDPAHVPFGRLLLPADIAAAAAWLLSDEGLMINGAVIDLWQRPR